MHDVPHVVIIGSGFGGTYVAGALLARARRGGVRVTVVNRTDHFLFTPLLHEVATGTLGPLSVTEPLREIFAGTPVRAVRAAAVSVDPAARVVRADGREIAYDYAVIATGAETDFFGTPGAAERGLPLKTLEDALRIRDRVLASFERASALSGAARGNALRFAVVGGGATGVELAAELVEFCKQISERYAGEIVPSEAKVMLVSASQELLPQFHEELRRLASYRLSRLGVELHLGDPVVSVEEGSLRLASGARVGTETVIWVAGVKPQLPEFVGPMPGLFKGKLAADPTLRVQGQERLFALGDAAAVPEAPSPMLAQVAVAQARTLADNLLAAIDGRPLAPFTYASMGSLVSLGQWHAIGDVFGLRFSGRFAWWIWRTVYLFKFISFKKRLRIAFDWTIDLFYPRDITRLS